ncbi:AAA family ATPase [Pseudomonas sp. B11D7D]|nr:AAA family ATPase [Pseudomonas sp. B11D7D]QNH04460.1 AAA family ATPase [Pseudomonas sp. B11D7D]
MIYIDDLHILNVRNIKPIKLKLGQPLRHLLITGRNGTGKTTLLNAIKREFQLIKTYSAAGLNASRQKYAERIAALGLMEDVAERAKLKLALDRENPSGAREVFFSLNNFGAARSLMVVSFDSKRLTNPATPQGPAKLQAIEEKEISSKAGKHIVQYLVNLWTEKAYANVDNDLHRVEEIDAWFENFRLKLSELFEDESLRLIFDRKIYNFWVHQHGKERFSLNQLSDGLSSAFSIVSELIMRMQRDNGVVSFERSGIVLIDEVETHLHVSLQKLILPFLSSLFPNVQFIVTTHSPFVLSSMSETVILDLDRGEVLSDFSSFSYEAVLEDFLDVDKYSFALKQKVREVEAHIAKHNYDAASLLIKKIRVDAEKLGGSITFSSPELDLMLERLQMKINEGRFEK